MAKQRMPRKFAAVGASVLAAIYAAGYVRTQPVDLTLAESEPAAAKAPTAVSVPTTQPAPAAKPTPTAIAAAIARATATAVPAQAGLKDGTFNGQGTSRRGNVWVDVTVQSGHIASVAITRSTLQYPVRDIAGLPGQVVTRQSAQVDVVSGATYSSQAFRAAVAQALAKANA